MRKVVNGFDAPHDGEVVVAGDVVEAVEACVFGIKDGAPLLAGFSAEGDVLAASCKDGVGGFADVALVC